MGMVGFEPTRNRAGITSRLLPGLDHFQRLTVKSRLYVPGIHPSALPLSYTPRSSYQTTENGADGRPDARISHVADQPTGGTSVNS